MAQRYGIDTSVIVRLVTGEPRKDLIRCIRELRALNEEQGCEVLASNQAIGEAYATLTHHYGASESEARAGLHKALTSGLVAPLNGRPVLDALSIAAGPGLFDRLIANDYAHCGLETLTLDRRMASLTHVRLISK